MTAAMTATVTASAPRSSLLETNLMSNVAHAEPAAAAPRGLVQLIAAVSSAVEAAFEVFAEAADMSAKARNRFPSAD
jgi:hypothetical protein